MAEECGRLETDGKVLMINPSHGDSVRITGTEQKGLEPITGNSSFCISGLVLALWIGLPFPLLCILLRFPLFPFRVLASLQRFHWVPCACPP